MFRNSQLFIVKMQQHSQKIINAPSEKDFKPIMIYHGNTGCGNFKQGYKLERFLPKNQHTQSRLLNFENRVNREFSKSAKV